MKHNGEATRINTFSLIVKLLLKSESVKDGSLLLQKAMEKEGIKRIEESNRYRNRDNIIRMPKRRIGYTWVRVK